MTNTSPPLLTALPRGLVVFWALWFTLVFATNFCDAAKALGLLPPDWPFASGNFHAIAEKTARYGAGAIVNGVLFAGVIAWEGTAAALFWRACSGRRDAARLALAASLGLWAAFLIADEIVFAYGLNHIHLLLFIATLATLFAIEFLPVRGDESGR